MSQYGPTRSERAITPEFQAIWEEALREAPPLSDPSIQFEAKHAGVAPAEIQEFIAHEIYLGKRRKLSERLYAESLAKLTPAERQAIRREEAAERREERREEERERREEERERREEDEGDEGEQGSRVPKHYKPSPWR